MSARKAILFSAPSGCGKTTIIRHIMSHYDFFEFSISATSRKPRSGEQDGVDYYFFSPQQFAAHVDNGDFLEWEEVYQGTCYGTLKSEVHRIWNNNHTLIFDVDVNGGRNLKRYFGSDALALFIMPPNINTLEQRLRSRATESEEAIRLRLARSSQELQLANLFDKVIVNDVLDVAVSDTIRAIDNFLSIPLDPCKL